MTFFEVEGVRRQEEAWPASYAMRQFENSCTRCAMKGLHLDCDRCAIPKAHTEALARIKLLKESESNKYKQVFNPRVGIITRVYICL